MKKIFCTHKCKWNRGASLNITGNLYTDFFNKRCIQSMYRILCIDRCGLKK